MLRFITFRRFSYLDLFTIGGVIELAQDGEWILAFLAFVVGILTSIQLESIVRGREDRP